MASPLNKILKIEKSSESVYSSTPPNIHKVGDKAGWRFDVDSMAPLKLECSCYGSSPIRIYQCIPWDGDWKIQAFYDISSSQKSHRLDLSRSLKQFIFVEKKTGFAWQTLDVADRESNKILCDSGQSVQLRWQFQSLSLTIAA